MRQGRLWTYLRGVRDSLVLLITTAALSAPLMVAAIFANIAGKAPDWTSWLYAAGVAIGYYGLPLLLGLVLVAVLCGPARRAAMLLGVGLNAIAVAYLVLDGIAYRAVDLHIDPFWIDFAIEDPSGLGLPALTWLAALGIVLAIVGIEAWIMALAGRRRGRWLARGFAGLVIVACALSQIAHSYAYEWNCKAITSLSPHFPLYLPITSHKTARAWGEALQDEDAAADSVAAAADNSTTGSLRYPAAEIRYDDSARGVCPNILLIMLESWRFDSMSEAISPNIHALGLRSTVCLDHMSTGNQTTCGIFGLFYGLHATYWTAVKGNSAGIDNPVLIDALASRGYAFGVFAKSNFARHKISDTVFRGIDVQESFAGGSKVEQDADLTRRVIRFAQMQAKDARPFFVYAFYKSTHAPYECPPDHEIFIDGKTVPMGFSKRDEDPTPYLHRYWNAVHYVDTVIGEIIASLEALRLMDTTVIIITSDHGESFNDDGENYWGHGSNFTQYQTRVPLIYYAPERAARAVQTRTSHVDIAPTLLREHLGCTNAVADYSNGRDLFDDGALLASRPLALGSYVNYAYLIGDDVYEMQAMRAKKYKLHDVGAPAAPPHPPAMKILAEEIARFAGR